MCRPALARSGNDTGNGYASATAGTQRFISFSCCCCCCCQLHHLESIITAIGLRVQKMTRDGEGKGHKPPPSAPVHKHYRAGRARHNRSKSARPCVRASVYMLAVVWPVDWWRNKIWRAHARMFRAVGRRGGTATPRHTTTSVCPWAGHALAAWLLANDIARTTSIHCLLCPWTVSAACVWRLPILPVTFLNQSTGSAVACLTASTKSVRYFA